MKRRIEPAETVRGDDKSWALGGISSEPGQLDRPLAPNLMFVPGVVEVQAERLVWQHELVVDEQLAVASNEAQREQLWKLVKSQTGTDLYVTGGISATSLFRRASTIESLLV